MKQTMIQIDRDNPGAHIEPTLFAHNLEHTRSCMHRGLSAQMIRNRKFAGKPACCSGEAAEWYRIGGREVYLTLDRVDHYVRHNKNNPRERRNELNAQVIQNPSAGGEAGIGQAGMPLKAGVSYEVRAVLKGRADGPVRCEIRLVGEGTRYVARSFELPQAQWHRIRFTFQQAQDDPAARFEIAFANRGEVAVGTVSLMPEDNFRGLRKDVIDLLREIGTTVLRWPGGNFAGEYRWKDGLMDVDMRGALKSFREIETHPHTHGFDFHEMAIDDFIEVCKLVGAEPYVTINLAWDSPEECAEFVEYCNGHADSAWGRVRAERGYAEPFHVKYWSLGNEFGLGHMEGPNTPVAYTSKALQCAKAMREVDPSIVLFASGAYNPEFDMQPWVDDSLPDFLGCVDYISYHNYLPRLFEHGIDFVTDAGLRESFDQLVSAPDACYQGAKMLREMMNKKGGGVERLKIAYEEWNLYFAWYHDPGVMEGLYTALMLDMFAKRHKELNMPMAMYFQPINEGAIVVKPYDCELTANGQALALMKAHCGQRLLEASTGDAKLRCLASLDEATGEVTLTLINADMDEPFEATVSGVTNACLLHGEQLFNGSRFTASKPVLGDRCNVPTHSILQLRLR